MEGIDITGQRNGKLLVLRRVSKTHWLCQCDCGNTKEVRKQAIVQKTTKSCGCFMKNNEGRENIVGQKFGRLTVIAFSHAKTDTYWLCRCDCGNEKTYTKGHLKQKVAHSCGCWKQEIITKHGMWKSTEYCIWEGMKARCQNKNNLNYPNYGGRGITVCEKWNTFEGFYDDMGVRPSKDYTIERIDVNGNYEPSNCKWATVSEQNNNKRTTRRIEYNGRTQSLGLWANELGFERHILTKRLNSGWPIEKAFNTAIDMKYSNRK